MSSSDRPTPDPRYSGLYQRGGDSAVEPGGYDEAPRPPHEPVPPSRPVPAPPPSQREDTSPIREIGVEDPQEATPRGDRNPFDAWIWVAAAVLLGLGLFVLSAPALFAESIEEQVLTTGFYAGHWSQQSSTIAFPLVLVGSATAVVQLFVLSHRHTRRTR